MRGRRPAASRARCSHSRATRVNRLSLFAGRLSSLVHELQKERSLSNVYLGARRSDGRDQLIAQRPTTDRVVADYRAAAADLKLATAGGNRIKLLIALRPGDAPVGRNAIAEVRGGLKARGFEEGSSEGHGQFVVERAFVER